MLPRATTTSPTPRTGRTTRRATGPPVTRRTRTPAAGSDEPTPDPSPLPDAPQGLGGRRPASRPAREAAGGRPRRRRPAASPCGRSCGASGSWPPSSWSPSSSSLPAPASTCGPMRSGTRASASTASSGPALGAQVGLFLGALVVALVVLLFNLWLAGRLAPPPDPEQAGPAPPGGGPPQRGPAPGGALGAHGWRTGSAGRRAVPRSRPGRRVRRRVRPGRHPRPRADREVGHRRGRDRARHRDRGRRVRHLDHGPAVDQPRPVLARLDRGRPGLRARHQLLPVRPAVPPLRPVADQRPAAGRRCWSPARGTWSQATEGGEVFITRGPRPPRGDRRPVPAVGRLRLPAGQVRAGVQHGRRRHGRLLHGRQRPVHGLRRAHDPVRSRGRAARGRCLHPLDVAAGRRSSSCGSPPRSSSGACTRRPSSGSRSTPTSTPRRSRTSRTTSR